jgi:putative flippase GtrA
MALLEERWTFRNKGAESATVIEYYTTLLAAVLIVYGVILQRVVRVTVEHAIP